MTLATTTTRCIMYFLKPMQRHCPSPLEQCQWHFLFSNRCCASQCYISLDELYVLPHWDSSCRPTLLSHPDTMPTSPSTDPSLPGLWVQWGVMPYRGGLSYHQPWKRYCERQESWCVLHEKTHSELDMITMGWTHAELTLDWLHQ